LFPLHYCEYLETSTITEKSPKINQFNHKRIANVLMNFSSFKEKKRGNGKKQNENEGRKIAI